MAMLRRIGNLFRRSRIDREIDAELMAHLEMRIEDNVAEGMTPEDARRDALVRFGNPTATKERALAADVSLAVDRVWHDIRYALRQLQRAPIFAATTVLTLALGIGATTAIFSAMNAVLLRLLPAANPKELYFLHCRMTSHMEHTALEIPKRPSLFPSSRPCVRTGARFRR